MSSTEADQEQVDRNDLAGAVWELPKLPRNTPRIDRLRWIVYHHQCARTEGKMIDAFTANMLVKVHDALKPDNQAKFLSMPLARMIDVGWSLVS